MEPAGPAERFLKLLLSLGALATASIALWLLGVLAIVLPSRDPQHLVGARRLERPSRPRGMNGARRAVS